MTKQEVLPALAAKVEANRAECRRLVEAIIALPEHTVHENETDLLQKLSEVWKQGRALVEVAEQLVPLVYDDKPGNPDLRAV